MNKDSVRRIEALRQQLESSNIRPLTRAIETLMSTGEFLDYSRVIPIKDNKESLKTIEIPEIALAAPHPHQALNAPYGAYSPFCLRSEVLNRLTRAQAKLNDMQPGYRLWIYDAYRPLAVQSFMIKHEFNRLCRDRKLNPSHLNPAEKQQLTAQVLMVWATPDTDPQRPPPHSTGAAVDLTIIDQQGKALAMGGDIDALGPVSLPNYFADNQSKIARLYHRNRNLLNGVMSEAGFHRLPHEWWHFSFGDQVWALLQRLNKADMKPIAQYGRVE